MTRLRLPRSITSPRPPTKPKHLPDRRRLLKAVAVYMGDKALGGLIGSAATAALVVATRTPTPLQPGTITVRMVKSITVSDTPSLALSERLTATVIRREPRDDA